MENIYTMNNWQKDGTLRMNVGQYVSDDIIIQLRDSVPPATYKASCFQPGEAYALSIDYEDLYLTFVRDNGMWKYIGLCPKGTNQPQPKLEFGLNESKQGLQSMKLFNIIKQHGGFKEKTPSFYLHDMTDDDVIGIIPEDDLQKLMKMHVSDRNKYAIQHGFEINRGDIMEIVPLKDDTWIAVIERGGNLGNKEYLNSKIGKKLNDRYKNRLNRGDKNYQWSDTGKWGSPRAEEFYMRRTQNDIANQRRQRYGDGAVHKMNESIEGLDKFATPTDITRFTNNLINKLYKVSQPYTSHRFRDNDWRHLKTFIEILRNVEGVEELIPAGTGPYKQSQEGAYKEYTLDITTTLGSKIGGFIRCHFCGSQENPWDVYDMTVNFYRNNEINENKNMAKIKLNENELKQIVTESVKRVLNEISSDLAYAAYDKAEKSRRFQQAQKFSDYGENKLKTEIGTDENIRQMNNQFITYYNRNNHVVTLFRDGRVYYGDCRTTIGNYASISLELKTNSKPAARLIVKWLEKYMSETINNVNPQLLDWHFWAVL